MGKWKLYWLGVGSLFVFVEPYLGWKLGTYLSPGGRLAWSYLAGAPILLMILLTGAMGTVLHGYFRGGWRLADDLQPLASEYAGKLGLKRVTVVRESGGDGTVSVGWNQEIVINDAFWRKLSKPERGFCLAHAIAESTQIQSRRSAWRVIYAVGHLALFTACSFKWWLAPLVWASGYRSSSGQAERKVKRTLVADSLALQLTSDLAAAERYISRPAARDTEVSTQERLETLRVRADLILAPQAREGAAQDAPSRPF